MYKNFLISVTFLILLCLCLWVQLDITAEAKRDVIIVIDPGHGGTNMGARYNGVIEKEATMKVAVAMKEELEKYEGVVVYLTRTGDESIELLDRAKFARDMKADIVLSLHFNMSEAHDLRGSEMWISSTGGLKQEAEHFAKIEQMLLKEYGIAKRGCFTRLNDEGTDYYGIIRESADFQIPAVIVEHCYLDRAEEYAFYDTDAALDRLGRIDATAVAMAYKLSSEELGVDYSRHYVSNTKLPEHLLTEDVTPPSEVSLDIVDYNENNHQLSLHLKVAEEESTMVYYQYSFNGGKTFSNKLPFYTNHEVDFVTQAYPSTDNSFVVRAYNAYGLYTDSEVYDLNELLFPYDGPVLREEDIVTEFITSVLDDIETFADELPPEIKSAATIVLIVGSIWGIVTVIVLFMQQRSKHKIVEEYQSEAKGA